MARPAVPVSLCRLLMMLLARVVRVVLGVRVRSRVVVLMVVAVRMVRRSRSWLVGQRIAARKQVLQKTNGKKAA